MWSWSGLHLQNLILTHPCRLCLAVISYHGHSNIFGSLLFIKRYQHLNLQFFVVIKRECGVTLKSGCASPLDEWHDGKQTQRSWYSWWCAMCNTKQSKAKQHQNKLVNCGLEDYNIIFDKRIWTPLPTYNCLFPLMTHLLCTVLYSTVNMTHNYTLVS